MSNTTNYCTAARAERYPTRPSAENAKAQRDLQRLRGGAVHIFSCRACRGHHLFTREQRDRLQANVRRSVGPMARRSR